MKVRSVAMVGGWALAVAGATAAGWAGVSLINDEVSPGGPAALSQAEVSRRIHATGSATAGPTTAADPGAADPSGADPSDATGTPTVDPSDVGPGTVLPSDPSAGTGPTVPTGPNRPTGPRTTPTTANKRSYTAHGGTVVLTCDGDQITASTFPRNGYIVSKESHQQGTTVSIEFKGATDESKLQGQCVQGTPSATVGESSSGGE